MNKIYSLPNVTVSALRQRTIAFSPSVKNIIQLLKEKFIHSFFVREENQNSNVQVKTMDYLNMNMNNTMSGNASSIVQRGKRAFKKSPLFPIIILVIFAMIAVYLISNAIKSTPSTNALGSGDERTELKKAKDSYTISKQFLFPLKDASGKEVSKIKFIVENAELRDEIIVKGKRAVAIKGRTFLIFNLKITNDYSQTITLNTRDYFRVMVEKSTEKLAPEIHNDPVEIQPISTKYTRIGLPINDTDKNITLQVGEISGKKENIKITFK